MKYIILMQYIPGNDSVWIEKLGPNDPTYDYDTLEEAEAKKEELQITDTIRGFKIVERL